MQRDRFGARARKALTWPVRQWRDRRAPVDVAGPGALSDADLDSLRDVALSLEKTSPFEAYALFRKVLQHQPQRLLVRGKVAALERRMIQDTIVAGRSDGLCERLNAIVIGHATAQALGREFRFIWPDTAYLSAKYNIQFNAGHSVPDEASSLLAPAFIAAYQTSAQDLIVPAGGLMKDNPVTLSFILNDIAKLAAEPAITRPFWLAALRMFPDLKARVDTAQHRAFFRDALFVDAIKAQFAAIDALSLPDKRVGIHLRGGDVVYGGARLTHTFGRKKSYSLAVADALCAHFLAEGYGVLVFGATKRDLVFLADKHPGVATVDDLGLGDTDLFTEVIREVWLMSSCEKLISTADTGVTALATVVGSAEEVAYHEIVPPAEEYRLSCACVASDAFAGFHTLQQAFIHYALFMTAPEQVGIETLAQHAADAHACDPGNVQYMLLCLMTAYARDDAASVAGFDAKLSRALTGPVSACFTEIDLRRRYIWVREPSVRRMLDRIAQIETAPDVARAFARMHGQRGAGHKP